MPVGGQIILRQILRIIEKLHIILINQILKLLLEIPHNNRNIRDAGLMELLNLPLNHPLPQNLHQALGLLKGERHKPGAESGGKNHRPVHPVGGEVFLTGFGKSIPGLSGFPVLNSLQKPALCALRNQLIHTSQRNTENLRQPPLRDILLLQKTPAHQSDTVHNNTPVCSKIYNQT